MKGRIIHERYDECGGYFMVHAGGERYGPMRDNTTMRQWTIEEIREWAAAKGITLAASVKKVKATYDHSGG